MAAARQLAQGQVQVALVADAGPQAGVVGEFTLQRVVANELEALYLNGPAGGGGASKSVREVIAAASLLMPRDWAQPQTHWLER